MLGDVRIVVVVAFNLDVLRAQPHIFPTCAGAVQLAQIPPACKRLEAEQFQNLVLRRNAELAVRVVEQSPV